MIIGVPKEVKPFESRVGLVPSGVKELAKVGASVIVEKSAGAGCGFEDVLYEQAGATIVENAAEVWANADTIIKVKEPVASEYGLIKEKQCLYTYIHLAVIPELARVLLDKQVTAVAYETIEDRSGGLPLLKPMSEVAGKMSIQIGAAYLQKDHGGRGVLLGGVPGIGRGRITIIGGGTVGTNACKVAVGMGADVRVIDINTDRLEYLDDIFGNRITTLKSNEANIAHAVSQSDLLIGAVLVTGAKAPRLVSREMLKDMPKGAVIVDVAVDQGGCVETCRPTTYDAPTFIVEDVIHYCVANMPGAVSRSSTLSLTNATLEYAKAFVKYGFEALIKDNPLFAKGLNTYGGHITYEAVAEGLDLPYRPAKEAVV